MMQSLTQYIGYLVVLILLAVPLGIYAEKVMNGKLSWVDRVFGPWERRFYRLLGIQPEAEMGGKAYLGCVLLFNLAGKSGTGAAH